MVEFLIEQEWDDILVLTTHQAVAKLVTKLLDE